MRTERFKCDQCDVEKRDVNHWYRVWQGDRDGFQIFSWEYGEPNDDSQHVCGQNCASILLARWMATGKLDKPSGEDGR